MFFGESYLIKSVAGRILWKVVEEHANTGRVDFTNKEPRLDRELQLPDINGNLEARLDVLRKNWPLCSEVCSCGDRPKTIFVVKSAENGFSDDAMAGRNLMATRGWCEAIARRIAS